MNKTLWNYYKQSADGQNAIAMFNPEPDDAHKEIENIATFLQKLDSHIEPQYFTDFIYYVYRVNLSAISGL